MCTFIHNECLTSARYKTNLLICWHQFWTIIIPFGRMLKCAFFLLLSAAVTLENKISVDEIRDGMTRNAYTFVHLYQDVILVHTMTCYINISKLTCCFVSIWPNIRRASYAISD